MYLPGCNSTCESKKTSKNLYNLRRVHLPNEELFTRLRRPFRLRTASGHGNMECVEFYVRSGAAPRRLGVLPGSFNPPTIAHRELVRAAHPHVDEVLCVLPRVFPHKQYFGATLPQRLELLACSDLLEPVSIATSRAGLFLDIAHECRECYGPSTALYFLCGADAAERILCWDYGRTGVLEEMLATFELLVAERGQALDPAWPHAHRIRTLPVGNDFRDVSSTVVRERVQSGKPWEHLVPRNIVEKVRAIYS